MGEAKRRVARPRRPRSEGERAWAAFQGRLAQVLATMTASEGTFLIIEIDQPDESEEFCSPYAQFCSLDGGDRLRVELSGNIYLRPSCRLDEAQLVDFRLMGWLGGDDDEPNHYQELAATEAPAAAMAAVSALRDDFHIPHPDLLTYRAWGPTATAAARLGLHATQDVPADIVDTEADDATVVIRPADRDELVAAVRDALRTHLEEEPTTDEDDDFVIVHMGHPVWVRVRTDNPTIEVFTCVVENVHSRRATAVELGILNRDSLWTRWVLRGRDVWQISAVPGSPFVPEHLRGILGGFTDAMIRTRDDLAFRVGGKVA